MADVSANNCRELNMYKPTDVDQEIDGDTFVYLLISFGLMAPMAHVYVLPTPSPDLVFRVC